MPKWPSSERAVIILSISAIICLAGIVLDPLGGSPDEGCIDVILDGDSTDEEVDACNESASMLWWFGVALFGFLLLAISAIIWVSTIVSSAGRGDWVWFALIVIGTPLIASIYFVLDKTGWGGFDNCKECW